MRFIFDAKFREQKLFNIASVSLNVLVKTEYVVISLQWNHYIYCKFKKYV